MESALTTKGRVTIPKAIREYLKLGPGDRIKFFKHPDGTVVLLPQQPTSRLRGIVSGRRRPVSIREMDEAIEAEAVKRGQILPRR